MRTLAIAFAVVTAGWIVPRQVVAQADSRGCLFSAWLKGTMAWESGLAESPEHAPPLSRGELLVRVISVTTGRPLPNARVLWNPGAQWRLTDSSGTVRVRSLAQGDYELRIAADGFMGVADSIRLGFDGLRVLASLPSYRGDIVCTAPARTPPNER